LDDGCAQAPAQKRTICRVISLISADCRRISAVQKLRAAPAQALAALSQRLIQGLGMELPPQHEENRRCGATFPCRSRSRLVARAPSTRAAWHHTVPDDSWFGFIAAADDNDVWTDPAVWRKANPSFGLSVKEDDLARKAEKAIALPGAQNAFRRMHLNEWTEQAERWIDIGGVGCLRWSGRARSAARPLLWRARSFDHDRRHCARLGVPARP
jgi:Terminase large subunit, endonuclease domain